MANASVDHGELINKLFQQGTTVPRTETLVMAAGVVRKTFEAELKYGPIKGKTPIDYTNFVKVVLSDKNKSYPPECVSTANRIIEATLSADLEKHAASSKQGISQQKKVPVSFDAKLEDRVRFSKFVSSGRSRRRRTRILRLKRTSRNRTKVPTRATATRAPTPQFPSTRSTSIRVSILSKVISRLWDGPRRLSRLNRQCWTTTRTGLLRTTS